MGAGISAMHYVGMTAVQVRADDPVRARAAGGFRRHRDRRFVRRAVAVHSPAHAQSSWRARATRVGAAFVMGLAISGMHYTGMAASRFAAGSYCLDPAVAGNGMDSRWLALVIATIALRTPRDHDDPAGVRRAPRIERPPLQRDAGERECATAARGHARCADRTAEPRAARRPAEPGDCAGGTAPDPFRGPGRRSRSLQGNQRFSRAHRRR